MILIMEDNFPEFAAIFWEYIKEGGYKCGWKNEENMHFYRFTENTVLGLTNQRLVKEEIQHGIRL